MSEMFEVEEEAVASLYDDGRVTVEITSGFPAARKIQAADLREGDKVFDCFGGTHYLSRVVRRRGRVYITREDQVEDTLFSHETITIIREKEDYRG